MTKSRVATQSPIISRAYHVLTKNVTLATKQSPFLLKNGHHSTPVQAYSTSTILCSHGTESSQIENPQVLVRWDGFYSPFIVWNVRGWNQECCLWNGELSSLFEAHFIRMLIISLFSALMRKSFNAWSNPANIVGRGWRRLLGRYVCWTTWIIRGQCQNGVGRTTTRWKIFWTNPIWWLGTQRTVYRFLDKGFHFIHRNFKKK